jgi:hypothetical protein
VGLTDPKDRSMFESCRLLNSAMTQSFLPILNRMHSFSSNSVVVQGQIARYPKRMQVNKADRKDGPGGKTVSMIGSGLHIRRRLRRVFLLDFPIYMYLAYGEYLPRATGRH